MYAKSIFYRKIHHLTGEFHVKFHAKNRYRTNREAVSAISVFQVGVRAGGGARGAAAPPKFGQLRFFGQKEKFGQSLFLKKFPCFFFRRDRYFLFYYINYSVL